MPLHIDGLLCWNSDPCDDTSGLFLRPSAKAATRFTNAFDTGVCPYYKVWDAVHEIIIKNEYRIVTENPDEGTNQKPRLPAISHWPTPIAANFEG